MAYITSARRLAELLNSDTDAYNAFLSEFNRIGHEYFDSSKSGYADTGNYPDKMPIQVLTKKEFVAIKRKNEYDSTNESEYPNNEVLFMNEASFDDAFRHAVLVDTSAFPALSLLPVDAFGDTSRDFIFTWSQVEAFAKAHPDGKYIIVHGDTIGPQFFLPIPTLNLLNNASLKEMGFARRRKTRKTRKTRKARKVRKF
jgi:Rps23 Pro-64 3,4-dihydroxylase Tpa1-like proline 4-hydroxylase